MSLCDGANNVTSSSTSYLDCDEDRNTSECSENYSLEGSRGFDRVPEVVVERLDITPFLTPNLKSILKQNYQSLHLKYFLAECSVNLVREDLAMLRDLHKRPDTQANMSLSCKICKKVYESEKKLLNHQHNKHMIIYKPKNKKRVSFSDKIIIHEVKEYHKCRKCPKIFEDYKLLKVHMKEQHRKRKCYICHYCTKKFVDRMFFKVHIKLHCEVCGHLSHNKSQLLEHKRYVCKIRKLHRCKTCNESFFKFMDLKDHSYEHISTCYICDICKDQFTTKCAIAHHICFLHSKRRRRQTPMLYIKRKLGNESLFLCKYCDESSVDKDLIESHIQLLPDLSNRAMTGYKDYYFCDQCLKKFDTETDMLQHKWSHFLKTSDNSQVRSKSTLNREEKDIKTVYNIHEKIPDHFQPRVLLEKLTIGGKLLTDTVAFVDVNSVDIGSGEIKKAVVDPKSKKTLLSRHQCPNCDKYYSSSYCLNRHIETQHRNYSNLQCKVCEEIFVWPSLLQKHKCIRLNIPEMPFDDARPEIHFDNLHEINSIQNDTDQEITSGFDDLNIIESDDYMNTVDFDIPAPVVQLHGYGNTYVSNNGLDHLNQNLTGKVTPLQNLGYKVVMQEVPIEF